MTIFDFNICIFDKKTSHFRFLKEACVMFLIYEVQKKYVHVCILVELL